MMLVEETVVPTGALPVTELKNHLRMGSGFTDDGLQDLVLETCLRAAMAAIEARTGKILIERAFVWSLDRWRDATGQVLPVAPVAAIGAVTLVASDGTETDVPVGWMLATDAHRPRLQPLGALLPTIPNNGSVKVAFQAGFGPAWANLPADLAQAVLMLAAHFYEFRHGEPSGRDMMPAAVSVMLQSYRNLRLGGAL